jgi:hypothetical protein
VPDSEFCWGEWSNEKQVGYFTWLKRWCSSLVVPRGYERFWGWSEVSIVGCAGFSCHTIILSNFACGSHFESSSQPFNLEVTLHSLHYHYLLHHVLTTQTTQQNRQLSVKQCWAVFAICPAKPPSTAVGSSVSILAIPLCLGEGTGTVEAPFWANGSIAFFFNGLISFRVSSFTCHFPRLSIWKNDSLLPC